MVLGGDAIDFTTSSVAGNLTVDTDVGAITQTGGALTVAANSDFQTQANDQLITLGNLDNSFGGTVAVTTATAGTNVGHVVLGGDAIDFATSSVAGNLTVDTDVAKSIASPPNTT